MAKKRSKTRYFEVNVRQGNVVTKMLSQPGKDLDFSDMKALRNLLTNEKARILYTLKYKKPKSIYELAKLLERDFKSVRTDIHTLERFGFIEFVEEKTGKRVSLRPVLVIDSLQIVLSI